MKLDDGFKESEKLLNQLEKEDDNIIMKVEPLRNDIKIETNSSYTFDKSGTAIFIYSDYAGSMGYVEADALIYKNLFEYLDQN